MEVPQRNPLRLSNRTAGEMRHPHHKSGFSTPTLWQTLQPQASLSPKQDYLLGVRGLLTIQSFLWIYLQTFAPTTVKGSLNYSGPALHLVLRKTLSVIFWNESLIYSWFIILSARSICIPFMLNLSELSVASSVFRRGLRLLIPTAVGLSIVAIVFDHIDMSYIAEFKDVTGNISFEVPYKLPSFVAYMNSVFNLFWVTQNFASQAGSLAFPGQTLWIVNVLYSQSYTVFMTMVIVPYTRNKWRIKALLLFILTAWWVQSWAWFSITGLLICDMVMNMEFKVHSQRGIRIWKGSRLPSWILYLIMMTAGALMLSIWAAWKPEYENGELRIHAAMYDDRVGLNDHFDLKQPQARADNYLFIVGFLLLLEGSDMMQQIFRFPLLLYLGRRSFGMLPSPSGFQLLTAVRSMVFGPRHHPLYSWNQACYALANFTRLDRMGLCNYVFSCLFICCSHFRGNLLQTDRYFITVSCKEHF